MNGDDKTQPAALTDAEHNPEALESSREQLCDKAMPDQTEAGANESAADSICCQEEDGNMPGAANTHMSGPSQLDNLLLGVICQSAAPRAQDASVQTSAPSPTAGILTAGQLVTLQVCEQQAEQDRKVEQLQEQLLLSQQSAFESQEKARRLQEQLELSEQSAVESHERARQLEEQLALSEHSVVESQEKIGQLQEQLTLSEQSVVESQLQIGQLQEQVTSLKQSSAESQAIVSQLRGELADLQQQVEAAQRSPEQLSEDDLDETIRKKLERLSKKLSDVRKAGIADEHRELLDKVQTRAEKLATHVRSKVSRYRKQHKMQLTNCQAQAETKLAEAADLLN